jgi:hypothetical protein
LYRIIPYYYLSYMFEDHQRDDDHAHNGGSNGNPKRRIMIVNDRDDINFTIIMVLEEDSVNKIRLDPFTDPFLALENFKSGYPQFFNNHFVTFERPLLGRPLLIAYDVIESTEDNRKDFLEFGLCM